MAVTDFTTTTSIVAPEFTRFPTPPVIRSKAERQHQDLIHYVYSRVRDARSDRELRIKRFAGIDRAISTWQRLKQDDAERQMLEEHTGRVTGTPANLPLLATTLEDTTAFFSEVFAPHARDFYTVPDGTENSSKVWDLARNMNRDTRYGGYYSQVARTTRALLKYNTGGMRVDWKPATEAALARNIYTSVDMYNVLWDSAVFSPAEVSARAEWAAEFSVMTRRDLVTGVNGLGYLQERVERVLAASGEGAGAGYVEAATGGWQTMYVRPPSHVGLSFDGQNSVQAPKGAINWGSFGLGDSATTSSYGVPRHAFESHSVWIWLDPIEFGLIIGDTDALRGYQLWRLTIVNGVVIHAVPAVQPGEIVEDDESIPIYLAPYTDDDMGEAQRSVMEYMRGFQRFASFLMNIWILASRKSVYGVTYYDKKMLKPASIREGDVAGYVEMETGGRDIRTGIWKDTNSAAVNNAIEMLTSVLNLSQQFFPNQALPSQVAGIDRAVKDQVSAVMAGGQARLRMQARVLDTNLFLPMRRQGARNYLRGNPNGFQGLQEEEITSLMGSGLKSLSAERAVAVFREMIQFIGVSPDLVAGTDLPRLLNAFSEALNLDLRLGDFFSQPQQANAQDGQAVQTQQAPQTDAQAVPVTQ